MYETGDQIIIKKEGTVGKWMERAQEIKKG